MIYERRETTRMRRGTARRSSRPLARREAWAATPARPKRRRAWRSKFPRCLGGRAAFMDDLAQESNAVIEDLAAARARAAVRRRAASSTLSNEEKVRKLTHGKHEDSPCRASKRNRNMK